MFTYNTMRNFTAAILLSFGVAAYFQTPIQSVKAQSQTPQAVTLFQQTISGTGSITTAPVNVPTGFSTAKIDVGISQPSNGQATVSAVIQGSSDGVAWHDMAGFGSQQGTSNSGTFRVGLIYPLMRINANWNGGFLVTASITLS